MIRLVWRSLTAAGAAITAGYALLCASPFTYHDLIRSNMFGVADLAAWHPLWYWGWLAVVVMDARRAASGRRAAWLACAGLGAAIGVYNVVRPILPSLSDDWHSVAAAGVALAPLLWVAAVDHRAARAFLSTPRHAIADEHVDQTETRLLVASLGGAVVLAVASAVLVPLLMHGQFEPDLLNVGLTVGLLWTLAGLSVIAGAVFLVLALMLRVVRRARLPWQYAVLLVTLTIAMSYGADRSISLTLNFTGWSRFFVDSAIALAIIATWGAVRLRWLMDRGIRVTSPVEIFLGTPGASWTSLRFGVFVLAILVLTCAVMLMSRRADWDFLLLKTATLGIWLVLSAYLFRVAQPRVVGARALTIACIVPLVAWHSTSWFEDRSADARRSLRRYAIYSGPLRLTDSVLRQSTGALPAFQRYLRDNSGLANLDVKPISLEFVSPLNGAPRQPPHIFLFVIDSLRPDYLAPYNPAVTFTPRIAELAAESIVFRNAITRYGATGLSLPAIWTGAVGPHKQYVTPFSPMNTLEKLIDANAYRRVMSVDVPMDQLLQLPADMIQLDRGRRTLDYELCGTLSELEARLPAIGPDDPPVFAYSSPKNLHLSNLLSASVPEGETYPGFHAPYAARVRAIDRCLGRFIDFLKQRRAYDRSLIVITSDHGEMLGEEGQWGHVYYLFPQILRIPLIVHLPKGADDDVEAVDVNALSFTTDISPTIYAALGYRPRPSNELMGHPLIGAPATHALARRRGDYVVEASYSAVYGVVRHNGRHVYIVDAMSGAEYAYARDRGDRWSNVPVVDAIRGPAQRLIREHVDEIRRVYRLPAYR